jgi:hypothetical protein
MSDCADETTALRRARLPGAARHLRTQNWRAIGVSLDIVVRVSALAERREHEVP